MHIFYSPVAEAILEASAPPLLWESPILASVKQLAARENSIWDDLNLKIIAERGRLYMMSIKLS
ncbi:hypothetical protein AZE42_12432 [Rhizopogon vesiculosus]|uniref:Uncharacterized protein n=1 Tax=Rhizopogon vesiculosus TaxID=180088 RepID=A0A1J8PW52_9AGAM|nr:hypothetical protein AZE42_12432 [Rhizopogon vesiculosus]